MFWINREGRDYGDSNSIYLVDYDSSGRNLLLVDFFLSLAAMGMTSNAESKLCRLISASDEMKLELAGNLWFLSGGVIPIIYLWTEMTLPTQNQLE